MRMKWILALSVLSVAALTPAASAQTTQGDTELAFGLTLTHYTNGDDDGILVGNVRYGYFLSDALELGGEISAGGPIDDLDRLVFWSVFGAYHFTPEETSTWYARGGYGALVDEPSEGFLEAAGGIKVYFSTKAAFFWEAGYGFAINSDTDGGVIRSLAGLSFTF